MLVPDKTPKYDHDTPEYEFYLTNRSVQTYLCYSYQKARSTSTVLGLAVGNALSVTLVCVLYFVLGAGISPKF